MSRKIKFRGKRCSDGQWVYGYYVESNNSWSGGHPHKSWILLSPRTNGGYFALMGAIAVKDNTVGQFAELYDKNGREIYDGDIIADPDNNLYVCTFENGSFDFYDKSGRGIANPIAIISNVIGNIYDNSTLINEANND